MDQTDEINRGNPPPALNVLIIDDDKKLCRLISDYLEPMGYCVTTVHTGDQGLEKALSGKFQVVILDVMMPGMDGFEVLKKLRRESDIPVLMLTARGDETDRIVGLEMGADDYLPKTFSPRELLARLRAVTRRYFKSGEALESFPRRSVGTIPKSDIGSGQKGNDPSTQEGEWLISGDLAVNPEFRTVLLGKNDLNLTPLEFDFLVCLMRTPGRILTRDQLLDATTGRNYEVFDRSVDIHISSLRRKLKDDPRNPGFIKTIRAAGYKFIREVSESTP